MEKTLVTILQNKNTTTDQFRDTSYQLGLLLAHKASQHLEIKKISIDTPLAQTDGYQFKNNIILVPILRSGIALLTPFLIFFQNANVGFVGLKRDEKTAIADLYYSNIPQITTDDDILLLDPMIATGGSAIDAIRILQEKGADTKKIIFSAVIASQVGLDRVKETYKDIKIIVSHVDKTLNDKKFIVPGLGDFGDRFFGTG